MAISIRRTGAQDYGNYMKVLICGVPGSGKTRIGSTAPNPIYASAEGGLMSIADRGIAYADIKTSESLLTLKNHLDQDPVVREKMLGFPVDTLVVDTIDEVQQIIIQERLKEQKRDALELRDWGWLGEQMQTMIRGLRNLPCHVILLCHLKETSDGDTGRVWNKPALQGQIADQLAKFVDLSLLLKARTLNEVQNGQVVTTIVRTLQASPDPTYPWIKDRSGKLPPEMSVNFEDDFTRIHSLIFGGETELPAMERIVVTEEVAKAPVSSPPAPIPAMTVDENVSVDEVVVPDQPKQIQEAATVVDLPSPEPVVAPPAPPLVEQPDLVALETRHVALPVVEGLVCENCGGEVESQDRADLSRIRFRKVLCTSCFTAFKKR